MLFSTQVEVVVELKLELSLAVLSPVAVLCFLRLSIFKGHASLQFELSLLVVMMNFYLVRLFFLYFFILRLRCACCQEVSFNTRIVRQDGTSQLHEGRSNYNIIQAIPIKKRIFHLEQKEHPNYTLFFIRTRVIRTWTKLSINLRTFKCSKI